jgi:hypothetical protein
VGAQATGRSKTASGGALLNCDSLHADEREDLPWWMLVQAAEHSALRTIEARSAGDAVVFLATRARQRGERLFIRRGSRVMRKVTDTTTEVDPPPVRS